MRVAIRTSKEGHSIATGEQHVIDRHDPRYAVIDEAAFTSKHLYNAAKCAVSHG
jgi:hypothetical protein